MRKSRTTIIFLCITLLLVVGITFTWSVEKKEANLNEVTIQALGDGSMELSTSPDGGWGEELTISYNVSQLSDVSGDGFNFYTPVLDPITKQPVYGGTEEWNIAEADVNYITFDVYVRSSTNMFIYLDSESSISPNATVRTTEDGKYSSAQITNKSAYGDFTKDYIAAATRLGVYSQKINTIENASSLKDTMNLEYIWVPNSEYELYTDEDNQLLFTENGSLQYEYYYKDESGIGQLVSYDPTTSLPDGATDATHLSYVEQTSGGTFELALLNDELIKYEITADVESPNDDQPIGKIEGLSGSVGTTKITFSFWVDGNDRESSVALAGGIVNLNLFFSGIELYNGDFTNVTSEGSVISGLTYQMEYSLDNGETYIAVTDESASLDLSNVSEADYPYYNDEVFIRYIKSDGNGLPSNYVVIDLS